MTGSPREKVWLTRAIALAVETAEAGGRPFGAVVALGGEMGGEGVNRYIADDDPTAHAEVVALRNAGRALGSPELSGATLVASTEPCPMCQAAALLAGVVRTVFATTELEAAERGYDARELLADLGRPLSERKMMAVRRLPIDSEALPYEAAARAAIDQGEPG
ncbi:MAG: nucleoside deaminase [Thermoleophilia bacterium]|nr:nucleoside deaminase [Thermoleophilia bacterium]